MPPLNTFNKSTLALALGQAIISPAQAATILVNDFTDTSGANCTLRQAIQSANTDTVPTGSNCVQGSGDDIIRFDTFEAQSIGLIQGELSINSNLQILGRRRRPIEINGSVNANNRNINISNANVTLDRLSITHGGGTLTGGGVNITGTSEVTITNSTISDNSADHRGGGIYADGDNLTITNSTISNNTAGIITPLLGGGGGLANVSGTTTINNSTISGNVGYYGGGIYNNSALSINNATISQNSAVNVGGGLATYFGTISITRSLIAGNDDTNGAAEIENFSNTTGFSDVSSNLIGDSSHDAAQAFINFAPSLTDINATSNNSNIPINSILSTTLADNGGDTLTHNLVAGSDAIDQITVSFCDTDDQRGQGRQSLCDIGSVEYLPSTQTITVDTLTQTVSGSHCSLTSAITASNTNRPSGGCEAGGVNDTIDFDSAVFPTNASHTITLTNALPTIDSNLSIEGQPNLTIDANATGRVFDIIHSEASINNLIMTGGSNTGYGAGVATNFEGDVTINNSTITGNSTSFIGGGVAVSNRSTLTVIESTISNNDSYDGGGAAVQSASGLAIIRSNVGQNQGYYGGGIYSTDANNVVEIESSTISANSAFRGAGLYIRGGESNINNTTISGNSAFFYGAGGIFSNNSSNVISNSTVSNNTGDRFYLGFEDGAVTAKRSAEVTISNSIVTGNEGIEVTTLDNGNIISNNNNLFGDSSVRSFYNFTPGTSDIDASSDGLSISSANILGPLANNGGPTLTHALVAGSPAINAGRNSLCPSTDQRGEQRDNRCDIGAYEFINEESFFVVPLPNGKSVIFSL